MDLKICMASKCSAKSKDVSLTEYIFLTYNINILTEVRAWERRKLALSHADTENMYKDLKLDH